MNKTLLALSAFFAFFIAPAFAHAEAFCQVVACATWVGQSEFQSVSAALLVDGRAATPCEDLDSAVRSMDELVEDSACRPEPSECRLEFVGGHYSLAIYADGSGLVVQQFDDGCGLRENVRAGHAKLAHLIRRGICQRPGHFD